MSTESRLRELTGWGGFSSFFSPSEFVAGQSAGVRPVAQVVGLAAGGLAPGFVPGKQWQRSFVVGDLSGSSGSAADARWHEHPQIIRGWNELRGVALGRLVKQAVQLDCQAVVGIKPRRTFDSYGGGHSGQGVWEFTGTAVQVDGWRGPPGKPALTLASVVEVSVMLQRGIEPVGVVGGVGRIEVRPSEATFQVSRATRRFSRESVELEDFSQSVYEVRHNAMKQLQAEAVKLGASGVVDVRVEFERDGAPTAQFASIVFTAHALGSAVRGTVSRSTASPSSVVDLMRQANG